MANSYINISDVTRKALMILENTSVVTRNCNRAYDDRFSIEGAKIGTALAIRLPHRATVRTGAALGAVDIQDQTVTLNVTNQAGCDLNFTTSDLTMKIDDFSDRFLMPRISQVAAYIDYDVCANIYKDVYNSVGTPGTTPSTSKVLLDAQQKLNENAAGMYPRYAAVGPAANAGLVEGLKGLFNPGGTISRQFKSGMMGEDVLGYAEIAMSQSMPNHTTGAWGTTITSTNTVSTQGQATLDISFTGSSKTWKKGDVFTIGSVYAVNPQTRASTGSLQQFVVTEDLTASSTGTLKISPALYSTGALQNIDSMPQSTAAVTMLGSASTVYPQSLVYHRDAITFATADLVMPKGVDMGARENHNGISLRIIRDYDINNDTLPTRLDVLYGYKLIRPEMAVRIWG